MTAAIISFVSEKSKGYSLDAQTMIYSNPLKKKILSRENDGGNKKIKIELKKFLGEIFFCEIELKKFLGGMI